MINIRVFATIEDEIDIFNTVESLGWHILDTYGKRMNIADIVISDEWKFSFAHYKSEIKMLQLQGIPFVSSDSDVVRYKSARNMRNDEHLLHGCLYSSRFEVDFNTYNRDANDKIVRIGIKDDVKRFMYNLVEWCDSIVRPSRCKHIFAFPDAYKAHIEKGYYMLDYDNIILF